MFCFAGIYGKLDVLYAGIVAENACGENKNRLLFVYSCCCMIVVVIILEVFFYVLLFFALLFSDSHCKFCTCFLANGHCTC